MLDKLQAIEDRFEEVGQLIVQPDATADIKKYSRLSKEYKGRLVINFHRQAQGYRKI